MEQENEYTQLDADMITDIEISQVDGHNDMEFDTQQDGTTATKALSGAEIEAIEKRFLQRPAINSHPASDKWELPDFHGLPKAAFGHEVDSRLPTMRAFKQYCDFFEQKCRSIKTAKKAVPSELRSQTPYSLALLDVLYHIALPSPISRQRLHAALMQAWCLRQEQETSLNSGHCVTQVDDIRDRQADTPVESSIRENREGLMLVDAIEAGKVVREQNSVRGTSEQGSKADKVTRKRRAEKVEKRTTRQSRDLFDVDQMITDGEISLRRLDEMDEDESLHKLDETDEDESLRKLDELDEHFNQKFPGTKKEKAKAMLVENAIDSYRNFEQPKPASRQKSVASIKDQRKKVTRLLNKAATAAARVRGHFKNATDRDDIAATQYANKLSEEILQAARKTGRKAAQKKKVEAKKAAEVERVAALVSTGMDVTAASKEIAEFNDLGWQIKKARLVDNSKNKNRQRRVQKLQTRAETRKAGIMLPSERFDLSSMPSLISRKEQDSFDKIDAEMGELGLSGSLAAAPACDAPTDQKTE